MENLMRENCMRFEIEVGGAALAFSTGYLAKQANGAVYARHGDTAVLVTSCMEDTPREDVDFSAARGLRRAFLRCRKDTGWFYKAGGKAIRCGHP